MADHAPPSLADFQRALTPEYLRIQQVLYFALAMGVATFAGVVAFLYFSQSGEATDPDTSGLYFITLFHLFLALGLYVAIPFVYRTVLQQASKADVEAILTRIRTAEIVRLAMFEGAALFGLVACVIGTTSGAMAAQPIYWGNLFSTFVMLGFVALAFPTQDRLENIFRTYFLG